jgi:phosphoglycerate dehydrogenase-like enzyme
VFCYPGFPRSRSALRERFLGTPLRLVEADPGRPLEEQVANASALIPSMGRVTAAVIAAAPRLRLVVQFGAGLEGVDRGAAAARGIAVRNVPGVNAQAVGELALFLMLALARRLPRHGRSFEGRVVGDPVGTELRGKTLGIVGLGASGKALATAARGLGMDVIAVRASGKPDPLASWVGGPDDLDRLLGRSDFVSLHVPSTPQTRGMMDAARFARMKPSAFLINVGRGDLVVRDALVDALHSGLAGAGLDVYWQEPPDPADPLFRLDNVVATPHVGGATEESFVGIADRVVSILREHLSV